MVNPDLPWACHGQAMFYVYDGSKKTRGDGCYDGSMGKDPSGNDLKHGTYVMMYDAEPDKIPYKPLHPMVMMMSGGIMKTDGAIEKINFPDLTLSEARVTPYGQRSNYGVPYEAYNWVKHVLICPGAPAGTPSQVGIVDLCPVDKCLLDIIYVATTEGYPKYPLRRLYDQWKKERAPPVDLLDIPIAAPAMRTRWNLRHNPSGSGAFTTDASRQLSTNFLEIC